MCQSWTKKLRKLAFQALSVVNKRMTNVVFWVINSFLAISTSQINIEHCLGGGGGGGREREVTVGQVTRLMRTTGNKDKQPPFMSVLNSNSWSPTTIFHTSVGLFSLTSERLTLSHT